MQEVIELSRSDVKKILAEHYGVPLKDVLTRKYSFVVLRDVYEQEKYLVQKEDDIRFHRRDKI